MQSETFLHDYLPTFTTTINLHLEFRQPGKGFRIKSRGLNLKSDAIIKSPSRPLQYKSYVIQHILSPGNVLSIKSATNHKSHTCSLKSPASSHSTHHWLTCQSAQRRYCMFKQTNLRFRLLSNRLLEHSSIAVSG